MREFLKNCGCLGTLRPCRDYERIRGAGVFKSEYTQRFVLTNSGGALECSGGFHGSVLVPIELSIESALINLNVDMPRIASSCMPKQQVHLYFGPLADGHFGSIQQCPELLRHMKIVSLDPAYSTIPLMDGIPKP